jgi:hypothetical protein
MGRRLEGILLLLLLFIVVLPFTFKIDDFEKENRVISSNKSTEIRDFIQYDINSTAIEYTLKSLSAEEMGDIWYLKYPKITNNEIKSLTSTYSIARGENIEFINNVKLLKLDGKRYLSNRAIYNTTTKVIKTPAKFKISKEYDMVNGINMEYFSATKETKAKNVKATFILKRK